LNWLKEENQMIGWSFIFLIMAAISARFAYKRPPTTYTYIAKLLFFFFFFIFLGFIIVELLITTPPHTEPITSSGA
jgi:uncharacterized membrane protein YtjA (UPF0391 family)